MNKLLLCAAVVLAFMSMALIPAATAEAQSVDGYRLRAGGDGVRARDNSYDLYDWYDDINLAVVGVGVDFRKGFGLEIDYERFRESNSVFGGYASTELIGNGVRVRGRYLYKLLPWVRPFATVEVGLQHVSSRIEPVDAPVYQDGAVGVSAGVFGGIEAGYFGRRVGVGVEMRVGYDLRTPLAFDYDGASPGDLDLSGLRFGSAFVITFHPQRPSRRARFGDDRRPPVVGNDVEPAERLDASEPAGDAEAPTDDTAEPSIIIEPKPEDEAEEGTAQDES